MRLSLVLGVIYFVSELLLIASVKALRRDRRARNLCVCHFISVSSISCRRCC